MTTTSERPLTPRQRECLRIVFRRVRRGRPPPTLAELAAALGAAFRDERPMTRKGVLYHVEALRRKGYVEGERDGRGAVARAVRLVGLRGWAMPGLPVFASDESGARLARELFHGGRAT